MWLPQMIFPQVDASDNFYWYHIQMARIWRKSNQLQVLKSEFWNILTKSVTWTPLNAPLNDRLIHRSDSQQPIAVTVPIYSNSL